MQNLMDIGANLFNTAFRDDRSEVIKKAVAHGIKIVITGSTAANSSASAKQALNWPDSLFATAGIHPHYSEAATVGDLKTLERLSGLQQVVAIGETGLDFFRMLSPQNTQQQLFEKHIELASVCHKPLFIHERQAFKPTFDILKANRDVFSQGVIHCFTGDKPSLFRYLDLDLHIGITGWVCDERRGLELQELVKHIPASRLMIETDSPYLRPRDLLKQKALELYHLKSNRNEPITLLHIAEKIAELRNECITTFSQKSYETSIKFFNLKATHKPAT